MARRKKYDDEITKNSGSVGYSQAALDKLNAGTYGRDIGSKRQVQYRTSQEQTQQSRQLPVLEGLTRSNDWESSFGHDKLNRASRYQQNLENEAAKYTYNESLAKANTLDEKDQGYLQRLIDNFGDGDVTRDALKTSTHTKDWEKKYGKSYDEIYRDFLADQGNAKMRQGQAHPILSEVSTALGSLNTPLTTIPSLIANVIAPNSKAANALEDTRSRYENQRKLLRAGVKERTGDKGDKVIDTVNAVADRMIPTIAGNAIGGNVLGGVLAGASDANRRMDELNLRPDLDNRRKALTALGQGAVEGVGTAITSGLLDKIPNVGGIGGRLLNVGKGAGNAAIENSISEAIEMGLDTAINKENSAKGLNKAAYMLNGMSEEDAAAQARKDQLGQVGSAALTGALFGGGMRGLSEIFDSVRRLPTLTDSTEPLTNDAMVDIIARDNRYKAEFTARTGIQLGDSVEDNKAIITDYLMNQAQPNRIGMNEVDNRVAAESAPEINNVQKIEKAIKEKDFKPITFNNPKGESYLITKSTRPGEKWQLSFISDTGNPTGHTAFRSDEDLIKEISKLKDENIRNLGTNDNVFSQASTTVGEMLENPDNYTLEDFQRVVRAYDVNADVDGATKEDIIDFMSNVVAEDPDYATASAIVNRLGDSVESSFPAVDGVIPNRTMNESASQNPTLTQEVRGLAGDDLKVAQAQQAQAVDNINRLSEQIPDIAPSIHNVDGQLLDTVKVPEYTADSNVFFEGTDADISLAEAQDKAITDTFKNIVSDPEFNALSFKNGKQEIYVSPSTRGNGYRMSYTIDGVPTGHHDYSVGEMDALSQNLRELAGNGGEDIRIQRKSDISRTQGTAPVDLKAAQDRVASNKSKIQALENEIKVIESDPNNKYRGNLKKSAKADIESRKAQIAKLKQDNKVTTRQIKGEPTPVIEQLDADSVTRINDFKKEVRKIGNMWGGEGGKQLAKDVNDALDRYIESGSQEDFNTFARDLWQLHSSANGEYTSKAGNVSRYSDYYGDIEDGIFGSAIRDNGILPNKAIRDIHNARTMNESVGGNPTLTSEVPPNNGGEPPLVTDAQATNNLKQSRVITNTGVNSGIIDQYDYDNDAIIKDIATYAAHSNEVTFDNALNNVKKNGAELLDEYNTDRRIIDNDQDVDQAMILLRNLKEQIKTASPEDAELLTNQRNMLLSRLREAGTKWGESIQAFAKWKETPEGAIIIGDGFLDSARKTWESQNKVQTETNSKVAEGLDNIGRDVIRNEGGYSSKKSGGKEEPTSSRLNKALRQQGYDGSMEGEPKAPKTHEQHRVEVENSIRKELGSVADQFDDNDFEFLTSLVESKVPVDLITDEIEHKLNHGEWYTIDESTPVKKATSSKLARILKNMGDDSLKAKNQKPDNGYPRKSHATITDEVVNTLEKEAAGLGLDTTTDVEFLATMIEEKIPDWQIEDEINHRLSTGEWYSLDESIEEPKRVNSKLKSALNSLVDTEEKPVREELSIEEIRRQVKDTLDNDESASLGEFTEDDVNYLANLIQNGATKDELAKALNTKLATGRFAISQSTQTKVNQLFEYADHYDPNSQESCEAKLAAYKLIAEEVIGDASPFEKFEAWRYLAMLGNPKTMIRNIVGNTMFSTVTGVSNNISAVIEATIDNVSKGLGGNGIQRTKSVLNPKRDSGLIKGAWDDAQSHRYRQLQGSKYEKSGMKHAIASEKSVFKSKGMQLVESAVDKGVSDYAAVRAKYSTSLAGWMKANGLDESAFDAEPRYKNLQAESRIRLLSDAEKAEMNRLKQTMDALEKGRDYAQKAAEYATFHEDNAVAKAFSKGSRYLLNSEHKSLRALGYGLEGVIPFKKTPANILRSGWEYSPLGAINSIAKTGKLIYENTGKRKANLGDTYTKKSWWRGNETEAERSLASDVIDSWSKTLTGSGLAYLGYYLMSKGILNSSESDEKYQDDLEGIQNYSITINGKTYTIDWAAPAVMPLLLGAEVKKIFDRHAIPDEKWYGSADEIIGSINALLDPMFETSMLQGIQNTLESAANEIKYNDDGAVGGILGAMATNAVTGYATQALPTILGQVSRTVDNTRRSTDTATDSNFLGGVEKQGRKLMNKTPLSFLNTPYVDSYGREQANSPYNNPIANLAYQMLSPAYIRDINTTDADRLSRSVYNALGEDGKPIKNQNALPTWKSKVKLGDGTKLNPEQMYTYRTASGDASFRIREALSKEPWFNDLSGENQDEILTKVKTLVNKVGLDAVGEAQTGKEFEAFKTGDVPALMGVFKESAVNSTIKAETNLSASSNAAKMIKADIEAGNTQAAEEKIDEATQLSNLGFTKPNPTETYYKAKGIDPNLSVEDFARTYKEIDSDGNQGIKQDEIIGFFNRNHYTSEAEAMRIWSMFAPKGKKVPYLKKDGTWGKH